MRLSLHIMLVLPPPPDQRAWPRPQQQSHQPGCQGPLCQLGQCHPRLSVRQLRRPSRRVATQTSVVNAQQLPSQPCHAQIHSARPLGVMPWARCQEPSTVSTAGATIIAWRSSMLRRPMQICMWHLLHQALAEPWPQGSPIADLRPWCKMPRSLGKPASPAQKCRLRSLGF